MGQRPSRDENAPAAYWEVVDDEVMRRAQNYRTRLQQTWDNNTFLEILSSIRQYYLALDLKPLMKKSPTYYKTVHDYFETAYDTKKVEPVMEAYTSGTSLCRLINEDLANMVSTDNSRDIALSPDAPQNRHYWEGALDIACLIVNHPDLDRYRIKKVTEVFRGMTVPNTILANYCIGNRLMNKTFLSTSKSRGVAGTYAESSVDEVGCLCIYQFVPSKRRTALDIQNISVFDLESEVLILPYTIFEVKKVDIRRVKSNSDQYIIELREWPPED